MARKNIQTPVADAGGRRAAPKADNVTKAKKAMPPPKKGEDDDDEDEDDGDDDVERSLDLAEDDLSKALDDLETAAAPKGSDSRKQVLLQKALAGDITDEENGELLGLMKGGAKDVPADGHVDEVRKSLDPATSDVVQEAFDVTPFLEESYGKVSKALETVAQFQEEGTNAQGEFNTLLAKAMVQVGKNLQESTRMLKAVSARLGVIEHQPARDPKAAGVKPGQVVRKSFAGGGSEGNERLARPEVLGALTDMMQKSMSEGRRGMSRCGEDLTLATAQFESSGEISKALYREVEGYVGERRAEAH